jgi:hypothetical protein
MRSTVGGIDFCRQQVVLIGAATTAVYVTAFQYFELLAVSACVVIVYGNPGLQTSAYRGRAEALCASGKSDLPFP